MNADNEDKIYGNNVKEICMNAGIHATLYYKWCRESKDKCGICCESYNTKSNAAFCSNEPCGYILCLTCFAKVFVSHLTKMTQYRYSLEMQCCLCRVTSSFKVPEFSSLTKTPTFHSILRDHAEKGLPLLGTQFTSISASFFTHRHLLNGIIQSSSKATFSKDDQALILKFTKFIVAYIGERYQYSDFAVNMKSTDRAFRWLSDAGVGDPVAPLTKIVEYRTQLSGLKKTMIDCVVQIVSRIRLTEKNRPHRHMSEEKLEAISDYWELQCRELEAISDYWELECRNSDVRVSDVPVIDLSNSSPELQGPFFET